MYFGSSEVYTLWHIELLPKVQTRPDIFSTLTDGLSVRDLVRSPVSIDHKSALFVPKNLEPGELICLSSIPPFSTPSQASVPLAISILTKTSNLINQRVHSQHTAGENVIDILHQWGDGLWSIGNQEAPPSSSVKGPMEMTAVLESSTERGFEDATTHDPCKGFSMGERDPALSGTELESESESKEGRVRPPLDMRPKHKLRSEGGLLFSRSVAIRYHNSVFNLSLQRQIVSYSKPSNR